MTPVTGTTISDAPRTDDPAGRERCLPAGRSARRGRVPCRAAGWPG